MVGRMEKHESSWWRAKRPPFSIVTVDGRECVLVRSERQTPLWLLLSNGRALDEPLVLAPTAGCGSPSLETRHVNPRAWPTAGVTRTG